MVAPGGRLSGLIPFTLPSCHAQEGIREFWFFALPKRSLRM